MKQRIEELDITKAIGIIMVVVGHTQLPTFMSNFIWSFHMPLFYIISGIILSQKKYTSFKLFLTRKIRTLIIPYIIFSIIIFEGYKLLSLPINNHPIQEVISGWYGIALWFLPNLFLTSYFHSMHSCYFRIYYRTRSRTIQINNFMSIYMLFRNWIYIFNFISSNNQK